MNLVGSWFFRNLNRERKRCMQKQKLWIERSKKLITCQRYFLSFCEETYQEFWNECKKCKNCSDEDWWRLFFLIHAYTMTWVVLDVHYGLILPTFQAIIIILLFYSFWPPLWSSGQSSWLQIRRPGFDSRHYQKNVVGLERGPLSLVSTTKELLDRKVAAPV
jgi:hypothetical protein